MLNYNFILAISMLKTDARAYAHNRCKVRQNIRQIKKDHRAFLPGGAIYGLNGLIIAMSGRGIPPIFGATHQALVPSAVSQNRRLPLRSYSP